MRSYLIIFIVAIINLNLFAQDEHSVVAQVGNDKITAKDFKLRFELSPYVPEDKYMYPDSIKYDFLYSWIAEKLWANEAEQLGIGTTEKFNFFFKPIEELYVRDALFKKEVEDKVKLSANDINSGIMKSQAKLNTQMISTNDSVNIFNFYNQIKSTNNFDSVFSSSSNLTSKDMEVSLGSLLDEDIEDSLYSLNTNQFTLPIKSEIGWVIFRIKNKVFVPIDLNDKKFIEDMNKTIKERRVENRYKEYRKELLTGVKIDIKPESFKLTFNLVWDRMKNRQITKDIVNYFELSEADFKNILTATSNNDLTKTLFSLNNKNINIESFLSQLAFDGFSVDKLDSLLILQKLNRRVKQFVENELITQEGYKQGLNLNASVREDLSKWREKYLAQFYFNSVLDSIKITDSDIHDYYLNEFVNASNIKLINIRLVTLKDLDEVSSILNLLKEGKDFGAIVKEYGMTDPLVNGNGETGLKPILLLGDLGKTAVDLNLNEVYGPIQRNNAYTIIQVIEKKDSNDSLKLAFDSVKTQLREKLRSNRLTDQLKSTTAYFAEKNNVKIYNGAIEQIKTSNIPMFVHRLMGFGGRIAGMPLVTPFSGWIKEVNKNSILP
ncbi:MAG: hypothetical protein WAV89_02290 [Ignavibacteriaceae bacterium]